MNYNYQLIKRCFVLSLIASIVLLGCSNPNGAIENNTSSGEIKTHSVAMNLSKESSTTKSPDSFPKVAEIMNFESINLDSSLNVLEKSNALLRSKLGRIESKNEYLSGTFKVKATFKFPESAWNHYNIIEIRK